MPSGNYLVGFLEVLNVGNYIDGIYGKYDQALTIPGNSIWILSVLCNIAAAWEKTNFFFFQNGNNSKYLVAGILSTTALCNKLYIFEMAPMKDLQAL